MKEFPLATASYAAQAEVWPRAVQLGLRGKALESYGKRDIVEIVDMSGFIEEQRPHVGDWRNGKLLTPLEAVYAVGD